MITSVGLLGAKLNAQYEFPHGIQTKAYRDSQGNWTGPGGILKKRDGSPVREGDTWTEEEAWFDYAATRQEFADFVRACLTVEPTRNQFDAMFLLAWNIGRNGRESFITSTALRKHNERRFEEAAEAFTLWRWAGKDNDALFERLDRGLHVPPGQWMHGPDIAEGPPGWSPRQPIPRGVEWKEALRGLYRRHASEGLLYLGLDWTEACADHNIELQASTLWQPDRKRWFDRIDYQTPWEDILARATPLVPETLAPTPAEELAIPHPGAPRPQTEPAMESVLDRLPPYWDDLSENQQTEWLNRDQDRRRGGNPDTPGPDPVSLPQIEVAPPAPVPLPVGTKAPSVNTRAPQDVEYGIEPEGGLKPMEETERYAGQFLVTLGVLMRANAARLSQLTGLLGIGATSLMAALDDPVTSALLAAGIAFAVAAAVWLIGRAFTGRGEKVLERGRQAATQAMY